MRRREFFQRAVATLGAVGGTVLAVDSGARQVFAQHGVSRSVAGDSISWLLRVPSNSGQWHAGLPRSGGCVQHPRIQMLRCPYGEDADDPDHR